ncbi:hypothetical protein OG874_35755 [Nocardia sp. NBC_00565]|uniref:hypothetical protein n=1 Tax=Nocardia sp. NBC_00565 TaxID=2975993 RepID=UPI002E823634|nr:hypothetical protein [Nocardia sp. NBC_00565]WUC02047.1 hypothetical protein OG874_35755 [Nocardia sp. NBC_00565]
MKVRPALAITGIGAMLLAVTGCAARDDVAIPAATCTAPPFPHPYTNVDPCAAEEVLTAAVTRIFSQSSEKYDPATSFDAASPLLTDDYRERVGNSAIALGGQITSTLSEQRGATRVITTAHVAEDDHPPDTGGSVSRVITLDQHLGDGPAHHTSIYARVVRTDSKRPWLLDQLEVR